MMGHRGAKDERPENTLKAIRHGIENGCSAIEIDIHVTKDGELAVIHDATLERTTNGSGLVRDKTLAELKKLDAGEGEQIPTLEEVMKVTAAAGVHLIIEVKPAGTEKRLLELLEEHNFYDKCIVICFNHRLLHFLKIQNPKIKTGCLMVGLPLNMVEIINACQADGVVMNIHTVDQQMVDECHQAKKFVAIWNANSKAEWQAMQKLGVDYVGTDVPALLAR